MRWIASFLIIASLAACQDDSPIVSGDAIDGGLFLGRYVVKEPTRDPKTRTLSDSQIQLLNRWLVNHRAGWRAIVESPPPPSFTIVARQTSGKRLQIDFFSQANWDKVLVAWAEDPSDNRIGHFSAEEVDALRKELGQVR